VLWDPETESYSYELTNQQEVLRGIAEVLGSTYEELAGYAAEIPGDPEFNDRLARHLRWRVDVKHRPALGHRLGWYVIARALKPALIVETGIYNGLGSLTLLRALERNAREGASGELLSFDIDPAAGFIVRDELRGRWSRHVGSTRDLLAPALAGREVGMMTQDTPHEEENQRFEFGLALAHRAPTLVLLDGSGGWAPTLPAICAERSGSYTRLPVSARDHVTDGVDLSLGVFHPDST
jgi:hypothetical protein